MRCFRHAPNCALILTLCTCFQLTPAFADTPYSIGPDETSYGSPYTAYRAGIGHTEVNRRPLDYSIREPEPFETSMPTDWSGFYFGANLGGVIGTSDTDGALSTSSDTNGVAFGGHVGKNWNFGPVVIGVEADGMITDAEDSTAIRGGSLTSNLDWLASGRARAGYGFDNFLVYGTVGLALAGTEVDVALPGFRAKSTSVHTGVVVGAGAEMELMKNVNGRVEALHYNFSDESFTVPNGTSDLDQSVTTIRAGISLKLN
jgi:outer membrane immunogenic protein